MPLRFSDAEQTMTSPGGRAPSGRSNVSGREPADDRTPIIRRRGWWGIRVLRARLRSAFAFCVCVLRLRSAFCVLRSAFCVLRLRSAFCVLRSAFCVLRSAFCVCVLRSAFCVLRSAYCVLRTAFCVLACTFCVELVCSACVAPVLGLRPARRACRLRGRVARLFGFCHRPRTRQ
jgi:hypothetical protein